MASIRKIKGKTGTAYKITVMTGRDAQGKQKRHYKTFTPPEGLTAKQAEKAAKQAAVEFEKEIELGYHLNADQTFEEYAWYVIRLKEHSGGAKTTLSMHEYFMERIVSAFGYMKLQDIRPQHLNNFYRELAKPETRKTGDIARPIVDFHDLLEKRKMSHGAFARESGISHTMVTRLCRSEYISLKKAEYIADFLGKKTKDLFQVECNEKTLSQETIRKFHGFISIVFSQAEKEMLIPYNPAAHATPPKKEDADPHYFQPDTLVSIMDALESEDIRHQTMIHLFIVTGCRRGEIAGLKWEKVDLENRKIKIDTCLSYTPKDGILEGPTKTRNTRIITIPEETAVLLRKYRAWYMEQRLLYGESWNTSDYLFTKDDGLLIIPGTINGWLDRFSKRHGLPHINPHAFRHSAASIMISQGVDIVTVSKMLGHTKTSMTTDTYAHIIEENKAKASECIADAILRKKDE